MERNHKCNLVLGMKGLLRPQLIDSLFLIVENHNVGVRFIEPER
jgi:hypothetical protein